MSKNLTPTKVVHFRKEPYDIYIGRPGKWGNPFRVDDYGRGKALEMYREWIYAQPDLIEKVKRELSGKVLGCWCKPSACHGDVLAEICNNQQLELFSGV